LVRRVQLPEVVKPPAKVVGVELGEMAALPAWPVQVTVPEVLTVGLPVTDSVAAKFAAVEGEQVVVTWQVWPEAKVEQAVAFTAMAAKDEVTWLPLTVTGPVLTRTWVAVEEDPTCVVGWLAVVSCSEGVSTGAADALNGTAFWPPCPV